MKSARSEGKADLTGPLTGCLLLLKPSVYCPLQAGYAPVKSAMRSLATTVPCRAGHAHEGQGADALAAAPLHWKAQTLDDMMQSVTAAEQRMLDISSMRVA